MKWQSASVADALRRLDTDAAKGLSDEQAENRFLEFGPNQLKSKKKTNILVKFLRQFNDFMIIILLFAAAASFAVSFINNEGGYADPIIILAIVILNAVLGLAQESRAEKSLEALKSLSAPMARVIRGGRARHLPAKDLTIGDIIVLESGDSIPADARLVSAVNLKVEESALTGESEPVSKYSNILIPDEAPIGDCKNMVFSGGLVAYGRGRASVVAIGMDTEVGKIAGMLMEHEAPETPLQKKLEQTGKTLGLAALGICALIFIMGLLRNIQPFEMFMTSVSLAVAAIPEGLPAIVTIMLALGVQRMARENAIIRKLPAVESLGGATVICSDKTGTLTQNQMRVVETYGNAMKEMILSYAVLCNNSIVEQNGEVIGDPTENALVYAALDAGIDKNELEALWKRVGELPFDSERKMMSTLHKIKGEGAVSITKGAPDVILKRCAHYSDKGAARAMDAEKLREFEAANAKMAGKALRVLAVAYGKPDKFGCGIRETNLVFAGLIGMMDPPRKEASEAVAICKEAGIMPVMITGDHIATARAVAKKIGILTIGDQSMTGQEISEMTEREFEGRISKCTVFARVSPEHKVKIVKAFQKMGHVVAMTGDGVNDAPALKAADIGCAMGINGTDAAKEAADMVLTDDNFATIVKAVKEGRGIFDNIKKAVHFLLSSNIGEIITIFTAIFMGWQTPLLAIHLLWVNLVTDSLPAIALGMDPAALDIMKRKPRANNESLFSGGLWQRIASEGFMIGALALLAFGIGAVYFDTDGSNRIATTMCFATLSISQLFHAFNMRSDESILKIDLLGNPYLIGSLAIGIAMQASVISIPALSLIFKVTPLNRHQWFAVFMLSLMPIIIVEIQKFFNSLWIRRKKAYA
ncbi:MAG: calcium-translocating P-type ATPase, PMCA-type [Clostridiales bacterium]|jgi:Ca2+-transporting ATPase|nr:calcium-translocating P-type ATPase, PMCA-type [Clostridiales bacterium]